ncbi:MAG: ABC transporter ATP-binding protein [Chlamydiae bacterium]|nr:ABC transporter ATP-binding protein [Chlamydiota bacterium]
MLKVQSIKKKYLFPTETEILSDINFEMAEGEILAIMGPSGSGKSTLLHIIGSLETPSEGQILLHNQNIDSIPTSLYRQKHVGFVFQSFHLLEDYTAFENLLLPCKIARKSVKKGSESYERALLLIRSMGLMERMDYPAKLLSGGEKQRIAVARALMNDPSLLLADEPTGNLDAKNGRILSELLLRSSRQFGKSLILVTHDPILAAMCDRILHIHDGRIAC